jgi:hypothetical protein
MTHKKGGGVLWKAMEKPCRAERQKIDRQTGIKKDRLAQTEWQYVETEDRLLDWREDKLAGRVPTD